jgi:DNA-binding response OmpR family regulator
MNNTAKILIVDDEPSVARLIEEILNDHIENISISTCHDGLEAYNHICSNEVDLVITDHKMPFCTGLSLITKMKEHHKKQTPVIFVSAYIPEIKSSFENYENVLFLDKPFKSERLLNYCRFLLSSEKKNL